ncbi:hypothetical protein LAZ67_2005445, partial [Cordylochernes scorpioides]
MRRVAAKFVPKLLNCDQKQHRMNIANEMLDSVRDDPNFLQNIITGDEAWVYGYDVEAKAQSSQWKLPHEPRPKKARQVRSNVKVLLTVFFDCRGVVHHEFLPQGRTVNKEYYLQVMRNLREAIRQKPPDLWKNKNWLLHHDNAPAHTSLLLRDFLAKNNTLMMPQPPYSPDLAPCDFFLFPKLKRPMTGRRYATLDEIKTASKEELKKILKNDFLKCFEDRKNRWHKCIISHGDYFEGDKIDEISDDYVGELVTRAEEARQLSRSRLLQSQAKDRRLYDQKHTPVYYQKDDLVWVFTPIRKVGLSEELLKRYFGPYKVTKKLSEVTYEVEPVDPSPRSRKAKDIVHVIRMKPYLDPEEQHSILLGNTSRVLDRLQFLPIKKIDQKTSIKFCVKNEIKCADAFRMLTVAYGEATLDRSNVYRWYKMFSEGREDVNDEKRAGRPSTSKTDEKINEVGKMILANRRITVREVAEDLNISIVSCHSIFINDLGMRRIAAKFVPKLLNCDQKQHRMNIANEMLDSVGDDPNLLQRVITGDEAWVYGYNVETKAQSSQWKLPHEPRPKKARQVRSNVKYLLTVFFDCRGVVHHEFLPQGRTVNKEYYLQVMRNLREAIRQKRPDLWKNKNWLLHHDNAPAHTSLLLRDFLAKNNTLMMPQPPYSPDLAP